ncbi:hypothetical protein M5K25_023347 [Dendrobium thyrsiflorum]|uniref:Uncharacterized protein n=1 Tax=Dendrobium thyrsiflorum TaxID=117978 RepID=A0ABD0U7W1_DENTH
MEKTKRRCELQLSSEEEPMRAKNFSEFGIECGFGKIIMCGHLMSSGDQLPNDPCAIPSSSFVQPTDPSPIPPPSFESSQIVKTAEKQIDIVVKNIFLF